MKKMVKRLSLLATAAVVATGCAPVRHNMPPEQRMMQPGPGVGGPGPGVLGPPAVAPGMMSGPMFGGAPAGPGMPIGPATGPMQSVPLGPQDPMMGAPMMGTQASNEGADGNIKPVGFRTQCNPSNIPAGGGVMMGGMSAVPAAPATAQVTFGNPDGMQVKYDATGSGTFDSEPLVVPARQNFPQGGLYRVKITNIPTRPGVELYPTIELAYANPRTGAYLAHNSVPIQFTDEDFDQVLTGNFVTKVIYLPDPDFQGPALAGIDTLVSTRLDPSIDPIVEADRRGSILAIIRLGDKDVEMAGLDGSYASGGYMAPPIAGLPAPFAPAMTDGCGPNGGSCGVGCGSGGSVVGGPGCTNTPPGLPGMIAGMTAPQYGMPITGTPIGLPGPPHVPLGSPAGLKKHVMRNHTPMHIPRPVDKVKMNVRMQPGYSYPNPVSRVRITEQNIHPGVPAARGLYQKASQQVDPNCQP
ncbi:MAG: hypothetical protein AAF958_14895 [Planctomycetota bacterium]